MNPFLQHSSEQLNPIFSLTFEAQLEFFVFTLLSQKHLKEAVNLEVGLDFVGTIIRSLGWKRKHSLGSFWKVFVPDSVPEYIPPSRQSKAVSLSLVFVLLFLFLGPVMVVHLTIPITVYFKLQREKKLKKAGEKVHWKQNHPAPGNHKKGEQGQKSSVLFWANKTEDYFKGKKQSKWPLQTQQQHFNEKLFHVEYCFPQQADNETF